MNPALLRAHHLLAVNRPDHAEREVRAALAQNPEDPELLTLLAICFLDQNRFPQARNAATEAVRCAPDDPFTHLTLARVALKQDDNRLARRAAEEAMRLDPAQSQPHGVIAAVELDEKRPAEALAAADRGLALDPDDEYCLNLRAIAQVQLNRRHDAAQTIKGALQKDPHNPISHANAGWTCLHQGNVNRALEHFRESLRIDPTSDWARAGMLEALRARYVVYRAVLGFQLWLNRLNKRAQWGVIVVGYIGYQVARRAAVNNPQLGPYLWPLVGLYLLFVLLTWIGQPFFNLLLRLNRFGRAILTSSERLGSTLVGVMLLLAAGLGAGWFVTQDPAVGLGAITSLVLILPLASVTTATTRADRLMRLGWLAAMAALAVVTVSMRYAGAVTASSGAMIVFLLLFVGFQFFVLARAIHGRVSA